VAEVDSGGNVTRSFGYQPGAEWSTAPLFLRDQNGYAYYQNDHLGAPEVLIDNQGAVVWSAILQAFGGTTVQVDAVDNPLRLPGQYFDRETGLHYNYFRDYDPATGSYLEADPLGIGGGLNRYAYANGDPLNNTDALGLCVAKQAMGPYAAAQSLGEQAADLVDTAERIGSNAAKLLDGNPCVLDDLIKDAASLALLKRVRAAAKLLQQAAKAGKTVVRKGKVYIRDGVEGVQRDIHELIRVVNENAAPQALQCTADYAQQKCSRFR
jgi:RHS repeat-associated protein